MSSSHPHLPTPGETPPPAPEYNPALVDYVSLPSPEGETRQITVVTVSHLSRIAVSRNIGDGTAQLLMNRLGATRSDDPEVDKALIEVPDKRRSGSSTGIAAEAVRPLHNRFKSGDLVIPRVGERAVTLLGLYANELQYNPGEIVREEPRQGDIEGITYFIKNTEPGIRTAVFTRENIAAIAAENDIHPNGAAKIMNRLSAAGADAPEIGAALYETTTTEPKFSGRLHTEVHGIRVDALPGLCRELASGRITVDRFGDAGLSLLQHCLKKLES